VISVTKQVDFVPGPCPVNHACRFNRSFSCGEHLVTGKGRRQSPGFAGSHAIPVHHSPFSPNARKYRSADRRRASFGSPTTANFGQAPCSFENA